MLYYFEELSYKEISEVLLIPSSTVGIRIKRAKEILKKLHNKKL
jgi:DNA-directed RNA polymerase specialized sigma24 family protein